MAEMKDGDWECPDCGAHCFASRAECFKCVRAAGGGGSRPGDWECPDCGSNNFANKEECFQCLRDYMWICPSCAADVFATKSSCFKCHEARPADVEYIKKEAKGAGKGVGKGAGKAEGGKAAGKGKGGKSNPSISDSIKALTKVSPKMKEAWTSYCDLYGEGWQDASKHERTFLVEFLDFAGELTQKQLVEGGAPEPAAEASGKPAAAGGTKRAAQEEAPAAPPEKKKVTVKKSVANKIASLNNGGGLLAPLRLASVAGALAAIGEESALEALLLLEEQQADVEDPNDFLKSQAQVMLTAASEVA